MNTFYIRTFGCQMNVHDSQRMHELLCEDGMREVSGPAEADVIVINTCSVRDKAETKLYSELGRLRDIKQLRSSPTVIVVAGCVARQRAEAIVRRMPFVDIVLGPDNLRALPGLAKEALRGAPPVVQVDFDTDCPTFLRASDALDGAMEGKATPPTAFVSISKGCDERCSYCIVPTTRGPERHRRASDIVQEIKQLCDAGVLEVMLLGQTVNNYQDLTGELGARPEGAKSDFAALLRRIAEQVPKLARVRYTSPHPLYFDDELIRAHSELDVLCRHVHMPVQSGSDRILKRMIRRHDRAVYLDVVRKLRKGRGDMTVSTDLIVGFPSETEEDFEQTLQLMREVGFVGVYAFKYSERPGTPSVKLGDDVLEQVKSERLQRVFELSEALMAKHLNGLVGTRQSVLVEEDNSRGLGVSGHTDRNEIVHVFEPGVKVGDGIVQVRVTEAYKHSLVGQVVGGEAQDNKKVRLSVLRARK